MKDLVRVELARVTTTDPVSTDLGAIVVKERGPRVLASMIIAPKLGTAVVEMEVGGGVMVETAQPIQTPSNVIGRTVEIGTRWGAGPKKGV